MRVIAGKFKGKILKEFELQTTRPTADLVRGALFNVIGFNIENASFLDLFSGTGAVGIEALSRSAGKCFFVDANKDAIKLINKNLQSIDANNYEIYFEDYKLVLKKFSLNNYLFDIVFLDPPYATNLAEDAIKIILNNNLLNKNGMIVWEHDSSKLNYIKTTFKNVKTKKYGKKYLTFINV